MSSSSPVRFFYEVPVPSFRSRTKMKNFLVGVCRREGRKVQSINVVFVSDERLLDINRQFLKHDYFTDIISFDLSVSSGIEAEIYISVDRVQDNADSLTVPFVRELHRVLIHGVLHLCGYKDKSNVDRLAMRAREDYYIVRLPF